MNIRSTQRKEDVRTTKAGGDARAGTPRGPSPAAGRQSGLAADGMNDDGRPRERLWDTAAVARTSRMVRVKESNEHGERRRDGPTGGRRGTRGEERMAVQKERREKTMAVSDFRMGGAISGAAMAAPGVAVQRNRSAWPEGEKEKGKRALGLAK